MNVLEARRRMLGAGVYKKTVTGNPAIAQGSLSRMYPGIEMQGWTEQDGTPTPENPVPIVSAGNWNEETQKWEYEVKLTGKNLLDIPDIESTDAQNVYVDMTCHLERPIIISMEDDNVQKTSIIWRIRVTTEDGTMKYLPDGTLAKTFQATPENPIIQITYRNFGITAGAYRNIQVEYGDVATEYERYRTPQSVTLTSDRPLTKWDRLEKRGGQWGWVYKSAEIVLDGSEDEEWTRTTGNTFTFNIDIPEMNFNPSFCNRYRWKSAVWVSSDYGVYSDNGYATKYFRPPSLEIKTVEQWREWLSENSLIILCKTSEETFIPLSDAEQELMNSLYTFRPSTVLSNDCDCNMTLTYKTKKSLEVTD